MARLETWYKQDLKRPLVVHKHTDVFNQDSMGNLIGVEVYSDGEPVVLAGSISGYCLLADGTTVPAVGASRSGNKASVLIPQTAYSVPGPITITIKNVEGDNITTLCATVGIVRQSVSGNLVNPGSVVTDWSNSINAQLQAVQTAADNVGAIVAAPFDENTVYVVGNYVTNNGNLYRITADHAAGVAWADTTKVQCTVGNELSELKRALSFVIAGEDTISNAEIIQGSYDIYGGVASNSARIRTAGFIQVFRGEQISFQAGTNAAHMLMGRFNTEKTWISDGSWYQGSTSFDIDFDGFVIFVFRKANSTDITPSEYDATTMILTRISGDLETINERISNLEESTTDKIASVNAKIEHLYDGEIEIYNPEDTSTMYHGYYTSSGISGGTPGIDVNWGITVIPCKKGTKIRISGADSIGGAYSAWLNSNNPSDFNKTAWSTSDNNGEKVCETDWLGLCVYPFGSTYESITVIAYTLKDAIDFTENASEVLLIRENILTSSMITVGKYYNGTSISTSSDYRIIEPIWLKKGQKIGIVYAVYAFTGFVPDGGAYAKISNAGGGGPLTFVAPSDGLIYITYTSTADNRQMVVINGDVPAEIVEPHTAISATLKSPLKIITVADDGTGDFDNPYDAYMSIQNDNKESPVEIHIKAGTYSLNDQFACPVSDTSNYVGIQLVHPYVSFIGDDPNTTILEFNGSPEGDQITQAQAMAVSIFHGNFGKPYFGTIKNLTLRVKNGRYCFHPETAGKSNGDWTIENCIFDFVGNPNVTGWDGASVGIGISHGETGHFIGCKWVSTNVNAVVGHNNAYGYSDAPAVVPCAKLYFTDCNMNGADFKIDNLSADSPLHDMLYLINCAGINIGEFGFQGGQTAKKWVCINQGSEIADDRFDY